MQLNTAESYNPRISSEVASFEFVFSKQTVLINILTAISITIVHKSDYISLTAEQKRARETFSCHVTEQTLYFLICCVKSV